MKACFAAVAILAHVSASPTPAAAAPSAQHSQVYIRLIGAANHYIPDDTQNPSMPNGRTIAIPLGVSLDMAEWVTAVEISRIDAGTSIGRTSIDKHDYRVVCTISLDHSSQGLDFSISDRQVRLNGGEPGLLTRLYCEKRDF